MIQRFEQIGIRTNLNKKKRKWRCNLFFLTIEEFLGSRFVKFFVKEPKSVGIQLHPLHPTCFSHGVYKNEIMAVNPDLISL